MDVIQVRRSAVELGKEIGLSGVELKAFIDETIAEAKAEAEAEAAKAEAEAARKEREKERKAQAQEAERQFELEKLRLEKTGTSSSMSFCQATRAYSSFGYHSYFFMVFHSLEFRASS